MELDDPPLQSAWPGEWWRNAKDDAEKRMMDRAEAFGLRRLKPGDHLPPGLSEVEGVSLGISKRPYSLSLLIANS
jgi:hypothetical protein